LGDDSGGWMSSVWPILHYEDSNAGLSFLVDILGFRQAVAVRDDHGDVVHAELCWPGGGSFVLGSTKHTDSVHGAMSAGPTACYIVDDDIDAVHERVRDADTSAVLQRPQQTQFGTVADVYAFTARDPEGNLWTFGTYRGFHIDR
jgi:uncharacterized glyoxalase superfamily protein PhnB